MLRVALTGGVGSGKSAAATMLRDLGAHLSQSDEVGRQLMQPGGAAFPLIVSHFGDGVLASDGTLDRPALARIAFDEGRAEELNAIIHPLVIAEHARRTAAIQEQDPTAVAVVESALVFETKHAALPGDSAPWRTRFDRIVVVTAPESVRRQRYMLRSHSAETDFDRRAAAQWPDDRKIALADYVLNNGGSPGDLHTQVRKLWDTLKAESAERASEAM